MRTGGPNEPPLAVAHALAESDGYRCRAAPCAGTPRQRDTCKGSSLSNSLANHRSGNARLIRATATAPRVAPASKNEWYCGARAIFRDLAQLFLATGHSPDRPPAAYFVRRIDLYSQHHDVGRTRDADSLLHFSWNAIVRDAGCGFGFAASKKTKAVRGSPRKSAKRPSPRPANRSRSIASPELVVPDSRRPFAVPASGTPRGLSFLSPCAKLMSVSRRSQ